MEHAGNIQGNLQQKVKVQNTEVRKQRNRGKTVQV